MTFVPRLLSFAVAFLSIVWTVDSHGVTFPKASVPAISKACQDLLTSIGPETDFGALIQQVLAINHGRQSYSDLRMESYEKLWPNLKTAIEGNFDNAQSIDDVISIFDFVTQIAPHNMQERLAELLRTRDYYALFSRLNISATGIHSLEEKISELDKKIYPYPHLELSLQSFFRWYLSVDTMKRDLLNPSRDVILADQIFKKGSVDFSFAHSKLLANLPAPLREELRVQMLEKIVLKRRDESGLAERLKDHAKLKGNEFSELWQLRGKVNVERRNLEFYFYQLSHFSRVILLKELESSGTAKSFFTAIEAHYHRLYPEWFRRGRYGFKETLGVAQIIEREFGSLLPEGEFIEIFGSFPDGRATASSDVDVRLSFAFSREYLSVFGKDKAALRAAQHWGEDTDGPKFPMSTDFYNPIVSPETITTRQSHLARTFANIEEKVAAKLSREHFEQTKLFAISAVNFGDDVTAVDASQSLIIQVFSNRLVLKLFFNQPGHSFMRTFVVPQG